MNRAIKWILICVAGLTALFGVALVLIPRFIQPNDYKPKIIAIVQEQTGRSLVIPGDIRLQISPKLDVVFSLGEIKLQSGDAFPDTSFASSELAEIRFALWPLLREQRLLVQDVVLSGVQLHLVRNGDGITNWDDLAGTKAEAPEETGDGSEASAGDGPATALPTIDIGGITISDINVQYDDQLTGQSIRLSHFNLEMGHILEQVPFPLSADFNLAVTDGEESLNAAIEMKCELILDLSAQRFGIRNYSLEGIVEGPQVPASKLEFAFAAEVDLDIPAEKITVSHFRVEQGELSLSGGLAVTGFQAGTAIKGNVDIASFPPGKYLQSLKLPVPELSNPQALERFSASLDFSMADQQGVLQVKQMQLDDTSVQATVQVTDFSNPNYAIELHLGQLDLDGYMLKKSPGVSGAVAQQDGPPGSGGEPVPLPVQLLKDLNFTVDVSVDSLRAAKLHLSDIVLKAVGKGGLIRLAPLEAKLYGGDILVTGEIDVRPDVPQLRLRKELSSVRLGPLFIDLTGREELSGTADLELNLVSSGMDTDSLTRNSSGDLTLSLKDGRIARLQILETIRTAKALLDGKGVVSNASTEPTGFARLTATGLLKNGVFTSDDLLAESDLMTVSGKGTVDMVQQEVDYLLTISLTDRVERHEETGLVALGNTPIPYRIRGKFTELEQSAALKELLAGKATELLFDALGKELSKGTGEDGATEAAPSDAGSLLNQGLKSLFGN